MKAEVCAVTLLTTAKHSYGYDFIFRQKITFLAGAELKHDAYMKSFLIRQWYTCSSWKETCRFFTRQII